MNEYNSDFNSLIVMMAFRYSMLENIMIDVCIEYLKCNWYLIEYIYRKIISLAIGKRIKNEGEKLMNGDLKLWAEFYNWIKKQK